MKQQFIEGMEVLGECCVYDLDFDEEDWVNIKLGSRVFGDKLPPPVPEQIVQKLAQFNQFMSLNLEFAEAPFEFFGESNIHYPGAFSHFVQALFD